MNAFANTVISASAPPRELAYDHQSRMGWKNAFEISNNYKLETKNRAWGGWNLIQETITPTIAPITTNRYHWGVDLSGTLQGAGGVGGLLAAEVNGIFLFPFYDANGNVTDCIDTSGNIRAHYEYDAFGNITAQSGDLAHVFPFRFSTKYFDHETGLYYYGYRFYSPVHGCWLNRDPIREDGGINLYSFLWNNPVNTWDYLGLNGSVSSPLTVTDAVVGMVDGTPGANKLYCPSGEWIGEIKIMVGIDASMSGNLNRRADSFPATLGAPLHTHPSYLSARVHISVEIKDQEALKKCCGCKDPQIRWRQYKWEKSGEDGRWASDNQDKRDENSPYSNNPFLIDEPGGNGADVSGVARPNLPKDQSFIDYVYCEESDYRNRTNQKGTELGALLWSVTWRHRGNSHSATLSWSW